MRKMIPALFLILCIASATAAEAAGQAQKVGERSEERGIWGKIEALTNHDILLVGGKRYAFAKNVLIDTESLSPDARGNVRIILDPSGKAREIFFNGIDMPEVFRRYKK